MYLNMYFRENNYHQLRKPPLIDPQSELRGGAFLSGIPLIQKVAIQNLQKSSYTTKIRHQL